MPLSDFYDDELDELSDFSDASLSMASSSGEFALAPIEKSIDTTASEKKKTKRLTTIQDDVTIDAVIKNGTTQALLEYLESNVKSKDEFVTILEHMTKGNVVSLAVERTLNAILKSLHWHHPQVALLACTLFGSLGYCDSNKTVLVQGGAGEAIVSFMKQDNNNSNENLMCLCAETLTSLAHNAETRIRIVKDGCIQAVVPVMRKLANSLDFQTCGCHILQVLSFDAQSAAEIVSTGGIDAVIQAMERFQAISSSIRDKGTGMMYFMIFELETLLSNQENTQIIRALQVVSSVAMKKTVSQETRTHAIAVVASIIAAGSDVGNTQLLLTEATKVDTASAAIRVMSDFHDDIEALTDGMNVLHAIIMNNAARTILVEKEGTNGIKDAINAVVLAMGTHITQPGKNDSIQTCGQEIVNVLSGHLQEELRTPEPPSPVACSQQQQEQQESPMETPDPKGLLETTEPEVLSPASSVPYSDDQFDEEEDKDHEEKEGREGDEQGRALEATRKQKQTSTSPISPIDFKRKVSPNGISSVVSRSNNVSPVISLDYLEHNLSPGFGIQPKRDTVISSQTSPQLPASHLQIENRKLEAKLEKLKLKMQKSTRENKDREEALLDENRKLQSALDQLRGQLDSAEGDVSSALEVENRELRASIEYLNKQSELHRAAESDSQSKMLRLEQELETCRNHIATVSQLEGRNKELEQATSRLQTELEHRGGDKNMAQELELGRRENEKLEQRVQLLIAEKIELSALKQTLSKERTERATLEGELAALRLDKQHSDGTFMELEHATGRVTQLEEELQKLTHSLKIAREEGLSFRDKKVQLEKQLQASELEAGQAFQKAEALQSKVEDLQVQLDKRTIQVEDVQQRLDTQQAYKCEGQKALQRKVQDLELHIVQEKQHMTQQHDRKVDLIKRQLDTEYKMVIKSMTASRSRLEAKLESIELENARYKSKISELSHELEQSQIVSVIQQVPAALPRTNHPPIPPTTLVPKKQPAVTCSRSKAVDDCPFMAKFRILFNLLKPRGDPVETVSYPSMYRFVEKCQLVSPTNARANLNVIFACLNKKRKGRLDFDNFVAVLRHLAKGLGPCGDDYTLFQHAPLRELVDSPVRVDAPCRKETCPLWDREKRTLGHVFSAYVKRGSDGLSFQGFLQLATDFKIVPCLFSRNQLRVKFVEYTQQVGAPCAVLPYDSWISLLQDIAIHKFPNQSNHTKVALLLQWMDSSGGKAKLHQRDRSALLIRKFNHNN